MVVARWSTHPLYDHYSGAWNAVAYRYEDAVEAGQRFNSSIVEFGASPPFLERQKQEKDLYSFYTNGISAIESACYAAFTIGAFISPSDFPMETARQQRRISPNHTHASYKQTFPGDKFLDVFEALFSNQSYLQWSDVRNILTHRTAPGRRMFVGIADDDAPAVEWKVDNISLDDKLVPRQQAQLASIVGDFVAGIDTFLSEKT